VSLISMKRPVRVPDAAKQRALDAAAQVAPKAKSAGQAAKSAGQAAKSTAGDAVAWAAPRVQDARDWAAPHVQDARVWAAPHVEQAGLAVRDKIAPAVSAALVEAARRIDVPKRRRWPRVLAGTALVAAIGAAIAAVVLRRRPDVVNFGADGYPAQDSSAPASETNGSRGPEQAQANGSGDEANAGVHES
jgi:hypothetical protein